MFTNSCLRLLLAALEKIRFGSLRLETPDGKVYCFSGRELGPSADIKLHSLNTLLSTLMHGDVGLAKEYRIGNWDSDDLASLCEFCLLNTEALEKFVDGSVFFRLMARLSYLFRSNTISGSKKNIEAHYDLGNEFYSLWLDPTMTYSCAIFATHEEQLKNAQENKYNRILNRLELNQGSLLEVGCGWGGFSEHLLGRENCRYTGLTISPAQLDYARRRVQMYRENAHLELRDYREQTGTFDYIVSIEMFEAVGESYWPDYFGKMKALLARKGKAVIQTITIADSYFDKYRKGSDAIRSLVFPGGMLPSSERFKQEAQRAGLRVKDEFFFGDDYSRTLSCWLASFKRESSKLMELGFDESFQRLWVFYLSSCIAAFRTARTDVMQVELCHA